MIIMQRGRFMKSNKKAKKWIKFRHHIVRNVLYAIMYPYSRIKYGIKIEKFKDWRNSIFFCYEDFCFLQTKKEGKNNE